MTLTSESICLNVNSDNYECVSQSIVLSKMLVAICHLAKYLCNTGSGSGNKITKITRLC